MSINLTPLLSPRLYFMQRDYGRCSAERQSFHMHDAVSAFVSSGTLHREIENVKKLRTNWKVCSGKPTYFAFIKISITETLLCTQTSPFCFCFIFSWHEPSVSCDCNCELMSLPVLNLPQSDPTLRLTWSWRTRKRGAFSSLGPPGMNITVLFRVSVCVWGCMYLCLCVQTPYPSWLCCNNNWDRHRFFKGTFLLFQTGCRVGTSKKLLQVLDQKHKLRIRQKTCTLY